MTAIVWVAGVAVCAVVALLLVAFGAWLILTDEPEIEDDNA